MDTPMTVVFGDDGSAFSLHREGVLPLDFLGRQNIERATDIRFDADTQTWGLHLPDGSGGFRPARSIFAHDLPSYEVARSVEVGWLERCHRQGCEYESPFGILQLQHARSEQAHAEGN